MCVCVMCLFVCCGLVVRVFVVVWCGAVLVGVVCVCVSVGAVSIHCFLQRYVYIQNAPMYAVKTPVCHVTHGGCDGTHGSVLKVHTRASRADSLSLSCDLYLSSPLCQSSPLSLSSQLSSLQKCTFQEKARRDMRMTRQCLFGDVENSPSATNSQFIRHSILKSVASNSPQPSKNLRATSAAVLPQETPQSIQSLQPEMSQSFTNSLERCSFSFGNPRK